MYISNDFSIILLLLSRILRQSHQKKLESLTNPRTKLPRLKQINLSQNQLTSISKGSLPGSIEVAWLDSNLVGTISRKVFSNLANLKRISLQNVSIHRYFGQFWTFMGQIWTNSFKTKSKWT